MAAWLLGSWVQISLRAWAFYFVCCLRRTDNSLRRVLPGGCESNCLWFQDLKMGRLRPSLGRSAAEKPRNLAIFMYLMSQVLIFIGIRWKSQTLHVTRNMFIQVKPKAGVSERVKLIGWFASRCLRTDARSCCYYGVPNTVSKPTWQEHYGNAIYGDELDWAGWQMAYTVYPLLIDVRTIMVGESGGMSQPKILSLSVLFLTWKKDQP